MAAVKADRKAYAKAYYAENRERLKANARTYAAARRDRYHENHRRWKYGLTPAAYAELLHAHGGLCAICLRERKLHIDHDHLTGKVRGLLCRPCNTAIGLLSEELTHLSAAIAYLRKAKNDAR